MTTLYPADTPVVTGAQTREDGYQIMRRFLLSSGATEPDDSIYIHPVPCDSSPLSPRQSSDGYYHYMVMGGFRAVGDDQHEAFRRMYEHALASGFTIGTYKNPASAPLEGRIRSWEMTGGTSAGHGFGFSIFTVSPQTHVAIWIASTCRVTPDRGDDTDSPFSLPGLLPQVPPRPPAGGGRPPAAPPVPTPSAPAPAAPPGPPNSAPLPGISPASNTSPRSALDRIRDVLG